MSEVSWCIWTSADVHIHPARVGQLVLVVQARGQGPHCRLSMRAKLQAQHSKPRSAF